MDHRRTDKRLSLVGDTPGNMSSTRPSQQRSVIEDTPQLAPEKASYLDCRVMWTGWAGVLVAA